MKCLPLCGISVVVAMVRMGSSTPPLFSTFHRSCRCLPLLQPLPSHLPSSLLPPSPPLPSPPLPSPPLPSPPLPSPPLPSPHLTYRSLGTLSTIYSNSMTSRLTSLTDPLIRQASSKQRSAAVSVLALPLHALPPSSLLRQMAVCSAFFPSCWLYVSRTDTWLS